jgi:hypothetical protein
MGFGHSRRSGIRGLPLRRLRQRGSRGTFAFYDALVDYKFVEDESESIMVRDAG